MSATIIDIKSGKPRPVPVRAVGYNPYLTDFYRALFAAQANFHRGLASTYQSAADALQDSPVPSDSPPEGAA